MSQQLTSEGPVAAGVPGHILRVDGLSVRYGKVRALDNITLEVGREKITGIIGPNGSGKSTFVNAVSGKVSAAAGSVHWRGMDITNKPSYRIARLGLARTFQHAMAFDQLGLKDNIRVARLASDTGDGGDPIAAYPLLVRELDKMGDIQASQLSFGQNRLLGIAVALSVRPQLLLLDEPAAGLNEVETARLIDILRSVASNGPGLVVIDHDMSFLMALSQRVVVFDAGTVIADGVPQKIQNDPRVIEAYFGRRHAPR